MSENLFYLIDADIEYKRIATLDHHLQSYNWTEDMATTEGGSFEIVLGDGVLENVLRKELFIQNAKGSKLGFITTIQYKKNEGIIKEIKIKGKMAEYILTRRHVKTQMQLQGTAKQIITDLITINVINTKSTILNIPMKLNFIGAIPGDTFEYGFEDGKKVSDALREICTNLNLFYFFTVENGGLVLNVKSCEDKSYMTFASDDSNLYDVTIFDTVEDKANCVVVKGDIINNSVPYSYSVLQGKTGIHVSEDFIDSSDFDSQDVEASLYLKMLQKKGNNKLMSYQIMRLFDSCTVKNKYRYPDEISLGDVVTVDIDEEKQKQRLVSFLHCKNSNNKEEFIFTLAQMPAMITATDEEYVFEDVPEELLPEPGSDITNPNINPSGGGGGGGADVVGRILCIDNELVDGTITKLSKDLYRVHIFTWNSNPTSITENEDNTTTETTTTKPYIGKIYFSFPSNILNYINKHDGILYIDNNDGSKTKIDITSGSKGVLYRDEFSTGYPLLFENPTEDNADADQWYEYTINSENLNFNFTADIAVTPVKETVPLKPYSKTLRVDLNYCHGNGFKVGDYTYYDYFLPETFWADEGDYIKLVCNYCELTHTNDPANPYTPGPWEEREFVWTFKEGEMVKDKVIRLPEGGYDFNNGSTWGWSSSFKKLKYLKQIRASSNNRAGYYGQLIFGYRSNATAKPTSSDINECFLVKQNPAFDSLEGLDGIRWIWCANKTVNKIKVPKYESPYYGNYQLSLVTSTGGDNLSVLENICDPATWKKILEENPDMFVEE